MATMRMCASCNRPNGPHFTRCISCGHWLGQASPEEGGPADPTEAARRANRLLEGMTPARRELLPVDFLRAVHLQSQGLDDKEGTPGPDQPPAEEDEDKVITGEYPRVESPTASGPILRMGRPEPVAVTSDGRRIVPPSTGRMRAVSTTDHGTPLDPPSAPALEASLAPSVADLKSVETAAHLPTMGKVTRTAMTETGLHRALSIPEAEPQGNINSLKKSLDLPLDIDAPPVGSSTDTSSEVDDPLSDAFSSEDALPGAGGLRNDGRGPLWEDPASMRAIAENAWSVGENDPTQMMSVLDDFPDLLDDDQWGGPAGAPGAQPGDLVDLAYDPMVMSLSAGRGPFGSREARFRLFLLPSSSYAVQGPNLRLALQKSIGMDFYTARLSLKKPLPVLLASGDDPREMTEQADDLRLAGAEVIMVERGYWLDGILPLRVHSLSGNAPGPVTFHMEDGSREAVPRERFGYCTIGAVDDMQGRTVWVLDLYLADAPVCLRVRSDRLDFSVFGHDAKTSTRKRMVHLTRWLSPDPATPLGLDDAFKHVSPAARSVHTASPDIEPGLVDFTEYSLLCDQGRRIV